jgi:Flp pilus assembly protein CpaB
MGRRLGAGGDEGATGQQARTATLEASPQAAEKIALVAELGKLALSLRSLAQEPVAHGPAKGTGSPGMPTPVRRCARKTSQDPASP